jgi:hypothetical protein
MAAPTYITWNGATSALTAATASVATGTTIKTMLQIKSGTPKMRIIEWGYSFDTAPSVKVNVELVETGTVFATVTQGVVATYNDVTGPASQAVLSTSGTGYTASAEGTVTATRLLAYQEELGSSFKQQFPLGREPEINGGSSLRIRVTTGTTINMTCYIIWEE